jgi:electron transfer flavoprotein beta subunit
MRIVVCVKQVPLPDMQLQIDGSRTNLIDDELVFKMSDCDEFALEAALHLKELLGGSVVAITVGPERARDILVASLAKGADEAIHIRSEIAHDFDCYLTADALSCVVRNLQYDLVLTGAQSDDVGSAQVGIMLAEMLGLPHASYVTSIDPDGENTIRVSRELGAGAAQILELQVPCLLTIQSGIYPLRYTSLIKILQAEKREVKTLSSVETGDARSSQSKVKNPELCLPETKRTVLISGNLDEIVSQLVARLRSEVKVI